MLKLVPFGSGPFSLAGAGIAERRRGERRAGGRRPPSDRLEYRFFRLLIAVSGHVGVEGIHLLTEGSVTDGIVPSGSFST